MSYIDIAIIVIVALGALIGLWKGFFKTVISFFGWTVSFLIAFFLTKVVASALLDIGPINQFVVGTGDKWSLYGWLSGFINEDLIASNGVLGFFLKPLIEAGTAAGVSPIVSVNMLLANAIFSVMVCLGMFIVIRVIMILFSMFAKSLLKDKKVGALNRVFGFVIGAVKNFFYVCIIFVVVGLLMPLPFMSGFNQKLDESILGKPISQQVFKLTDKFIINGGILDKLLDFAGLGKEDEHTLTEKEAQFKTEVLQKAMLRGEVADKAAFDAAYKGAGIDTELDNLWKYFDACAASVDKKCIDAKDLTSVSAALEAGGSVYNKITELLAEAELCKAGTGSFLSLEAKLAELNTALIASGLSAAAGNPGIFDVAYPQLILKPALPEEGGEQEQGAALALRGFGRGVYLNFMPVAA